jgi:hypothetical protein
MTATTYCVFEPDAALNINVETDGRVQWGPLRHHQSNIQNMPVGSPW